MQTEKELKKEPKLAPVATLEDAMMGLVVEPSSPVLGAPVTDQR